MNMTRQAVRLPLSCMVRAGGHGAGLCQIGAAVMSAEGYDYRAILQHYYPHTRLQTLY
jgi:Sporulation protein and related proteins